MFKSIYNLHCAAMIVTQAAESTLLWSLKRVCMFVMQNGYVKCCCGNQEKLMFKTTHFVRW